MDPISGKIGEKYIFQHIVDIKQPDTMKTLKYCALMAGTAVSETYLLPSSFASFAYHCLQHDGKIAEKTVGSRANLLVMGIHADWAYADAVSFTGAGGSVPLLALFEGQR